MSFSVRITPSADTFDARPGEPLLDAALRSRVAIPYGCRNGACRSCRGRVVSGRVAYPAGVPNVLSDWESEHGWTLLCQARAESDLELEVDVISAAEDIEVRTLRCRVASKDLLAHDVMRLRLALPEGERLQFLAGQYVDIVLRDGRRRAFSLASSPLADDHLELHVRLVPDGEFSGYVFSHLPERALLRVRGPLGAFYLRERSERPVVFVAGGTGFAPIKGIIEHVLARGLGRPMHLYCGVRAKRDLYMDAIAGRWAHEHEWLRYVPVLSEPRPEDDWSGRTGLVHEAVLADLGDLSGFDVYTSGPPVLVSAVRETFRERGLDLAHLYADAFEHAFETGHDG